MIKNERGFTFLEMSIVIAIISILMLLAMPNYKGAAERAQEKSCEANRKMIESQVQNYLLDKNAEPANVAALVTDKYIKNPICPTGGAYTFTIGDDEIEVFCSKHHAAES